MFRRHSTKTLTKVYNPAAIEAGTIDKIKADNAAERQLFEEEESRAKPTSTKKRAAAGEQATKKKRIGDEAVVESTTVIVDEPLVTETECTAIAPPIPARNTKTLGNQEKPAGVVFAACYDNAAVFAKVLSKIQNLSSNFNILFNRDGMSITILDIAQVLLLSITVPAAGFLMYKDLLDKPIDFAVNGKAWTRVERMCKPDRTFTFMYDQCTLDTEPLQVMLFPNDGRRASGQESRIVLAPSEEQEPIVIPHDNYQYEVAVSSRQFYDNICNLAAEDDCVRIMLSSTAIEMSAVGESGSSRQTHSVPVGDKVENQQCTLKRIGKPNSKVTLAEFQMFRFSAVFLQHACKFANIAECNLLILRFGVQVTTNESGKVQVIEEPLYMNFPVRANDSKGKFDVRLWLAPKIED